ncbi:MAG: acyl dehydratase [Planctomycetes bacterium]|nr:acyl dehydratase [Planctomycetota bacterium]
MAPLQRIRLNVPRRCCTAMVPSQTDMQTALSYEQLNIGDRWTSGSRTIAMEEIHLFAGLTGDNDPLHMDPEFAAKGPFGQPIAHGMLGMSILIGLSSTAPRVRTSAFVDIRGWNFLKPVFPGDSVHVVTEIVDMKPHGRRHGEVHWYRQLINQKGDKVQDGILVTLIARQAPVSNKTKRIEPAHTMADSSVNMNPSLAVPQPVSSASLAQEALLEGV